MTTVDIPPKIHKKLKKEAFRREMDLKDLVAEKLKVLVIVALFTTAIGFSAAYGDTLNLQVDTTNLNSTTTEQNTQTNSDGSISVFTSILFHHLFPADKGPSADTKLVGADPQGSIFDTIIHDGAKIFEPIITPVLKVIADVEIMLEVAPEPERVFTHEEQERINEVKRFCERLSERLKAIGLAHEFEYKSDEFYADNEIVAKKDAQDCRARFHLGNDVLGSMYNSLAEEAKKDAVDFLDIETTQGPRSQYDIDMEELKQQMADDALDHAKNNLTKTHGYGKTYDTQYKELNNTKSTDHNAPTEAEKAHKQHVQQEENDKRAWEKACNGYWNDAGEGSLASTSWDTHLVNGDCDGRILDKWDTRGESYLNVTALYNEKVEQEKRDAEELQQKRLDAIERQEQARINALIEAGILPNATATNGTGN
jgi:hypothetical protein